jgi:hypothetical protein
VRYVAPVNTRGSLTLTLMLTACSPERAPTPPARLAPLSARAADELVLDVSARGDVLLGRVLPVPAQSDADRTLRVRMVTSNGQRRWGFGDTPVIEARFVPRGEALLVITTTHELVRLDGPEAAPRVIDQHVFGPLSLDALGRAAVYTRGEMPELQVVRADLATGETRALAPSLVPAWCPTLAGDGREVITVASPEGTPGLWRIRPDAPPARWDLPADTALPTGPSAPVVFGDMLVYESDGALHALGFDGTRRRSLPGVGLPVLTVGSPALLAHDARHQPVTLLPRDLDAPR